MDDQKLQHLISDYLQKYHTPAQHATILQNVLTVGKASKPWVEAIQRYVYDVSYQTPDRGAIKRACRALQSRQQAKDGF